MLKLAQKIKQLTTQVVKKTLSPQEKELKKKIKKYFGEAQTKSS